MYERTIIVEPATPAAIAPYGQFVGAHVEVPVFASWPGVTIHGGLPFSIGERGELLLVQMAPRAFPLRCSLMERHPKHTQTYLPFNAKPFVMLLGEPTDGDLPDYARLRAFRFDGTGGIILHTDVWHDFPYALEEDTQFAVVLDAASHINETTAPAQQYDADGPDLQRRGLTSRAIITVALAVYPDLQGAINDRG